MLPVREQQGHKSFGVVPDIRQKIMKVTWFTDTVSNDVTHLHYKRMQLWRQGLASHGWQVSLACKLPHMCVYRDRRMLVAGEQSHTGSNFGSNTLQLS